MIRECFKKRFMPVPRNIRLRYHLKRAACLGDFFLGRRAECMRVNGQLGLQFAIAQNLDGIRGAANEAVGAQQFRRHRFAGGKHVQFLHVHHGIVHFERIVKAALGHAAVQRHLAAFKTAAARIAAARFLSLVAGARRLAELRADTAANAHSCVARTLRGAQIRKMYSCDEVFFRFAADFMVYQPLITPPLPPDAAPCGSCRESPACPRARQSDAYVRKPEAANRLPHVVGAADEADHPLDFYRSGALRAFFLGCHGLFSCCLFSFFAL